MHVRIKYKTMTKTYHSENALVSCKMPALFPAWNTLLQHNSARIIHIKHKYHRLILWWRLGNHSWSSLCVHSSCLSDLPCLICDSLIFHNGCVNRDSCFPGHIQHDDKEGRQSSSGRIGRDYETSHNQLYFTRQPPTLSFPLGRVFSEFIGFTSLHTVAKFHFWLYFYFSVKHCCSFFSPWNSFLFGKVQSW